MRSSTVPPNSQSAQDQMQPSAVQEHVREEWLPVGGRVAEVEIRREIEPGDERKAPEKGLELIRTRTPLVKENQAVRRDQRPREERRTAGRRGIQDRKHGARCRCGRRSMSGRGLVQCARLGRASSTCGRRSRKTSQRPTDAPPRPGRGFCCQYFFPPRLSQREPCLSQALRVDAKPNHLWPNEQRADLRQFSDS